MRASMIMKNYGHDVTAILEKTRLTCLHSEPNYGVLWFYHKNKELADKRANEEAAAFIKEWGGARGRMEAEI